VFTPLETDVERAVFALSNRKRGDEYRVLPAKTVRELSPEAEFLAHIRTGDNRLGPDMAEKVLTEAGSLLRAMLMLTNEDGSLDGIGAKRKAGIRKFFNLLPGENLWTTNS
jgi:ERCC4-type nuclease